MNETDSRNSLESENDIVNVVNGFIWLVLTAGIVIYLPILYKKIRCKFPVTVNCWFCNKNSRVPYDDANCWDCPYCEQYNGFNKDGGYNKEIKEQHSPNLNPLVYSNVVKNSNNDVLTKEQTASNGFCKLCNINQQLKIQQLARFVPLDEENYDQEVEQFREQLEKSYRLCSQCEKTLTITLQNQQYNLLKNRLNNQKDKNQFLSVNNISGNYDYQQIFQMLRGVLCFGLKLISGLISFLMLLSFASQMETELQLLKSTLPDMFILDYQPILQEFLYYLTYSYNVRKELISVGLLCYALSSFCRQTRSDHPSLLLFWGILYAMSWSDMTALQVLVSTVCVLLSVLEMKTSPTYTLKKLPRMEPERIQNAKGGEASAAPSETGDESETERRGRSEKPNEGEESLRLFNDAKVVESVREIPQMESPKSKTPPKFQVNESQTPQMRSNNIFSKNFLAALESERIEKEMSPPPEIFRNLNNLHIGNNPTPSEKPSNFLFENHNFEERCKRTSPIIKSPKFVKSSPNSWANGELNETISRSSTPSSGYSSQKADKPESRQSFHFPKVISPVPFGRRSSPENFDYWDRNHPCFSANNYHYFPPGYMPFPGNPLGHTTVYTYTRPASYPFAFPPSPTSPTFSFPSGQRTPPRFSDVSETENLFQSASSSFQRNQKWSSIKSALYYVSIFLNVVSTCVLAYFTWSGIISLTGN